MDESVSAIRIRALSIQTGEAVRPSSQSRKVETSGAESFDSLLAKAVDRGRSLKFSAHAQNRLAGRGIDLSDAEKARLESGVEKAGAKGARDALLVMDGKGFITNVKSKTVLTALDMTELDSRVVTNIDSAVFL